MEVDFAAAGRAFEFVGIVMDNLVTLHAAFLLGFIFGVVGLRRIGRGSWSDMTNVGFLLGITAMVFLAIVFVGLRLDISQWALFLFGLAAATVAWTISGGVPARVRRPFDAGASFIASGVSSAAYRIRRPRVPDRLPSDLRSFDIRRS